MMQEKSLPTLADVASAAGVSTATVSRCLNAPDRVGPETRQKVLLAVDRLGYTPNFGARAMAARRTFTIGAIIPTMENAIFARGLQAFQETLRSHGYTLLVFSTGYSAEVEAEQIRALISRGADGLLLIGHARDAPIQSYIQGRGIPTLVAWAYSDASPLPSVGFDNRASMQALAEVVIGMGHRKIGVISALTAGNDRAARRIAGIRDALTAHGLDPHAATVIETPYGIDNGAAAFGRIMTGPNPPSVVMCGNDVLAVGALRQAQKMGLAVPGDVSITGFDDIELARIISPELTTVHVPHRRMGRLAADELVRMVEGKSPGTSVEIKVSLKLRGSLGVAGWCAGQKPPCTEGGTS